MTRQAPSASDRIRHSRSYRYALSRASKLVKNPRKLYRTSLQAIDKSEKLTRHKWQEFRHSLGALARLVLAYCQGEYRNVSWYNLILMVAALVYFITPVDVIPDIITGFGYIDDAMLLGWTLTAVGEEIERFQHHEQARGDSETGSKTLTGANGK